MTRHTAQITEMETAWLSQAGAQPAPAVLTMFWVWRCQVPPWTEMG